MRFNQEFVERVAEASNLVDIISQYTQLKPSGGGLMGRCPFPDHPEKTPSFSVSETKQVYHCFGCHKSGNIFTFLQQYNGMSFREAIEYLAARAHIALPETSEKENTEQDRLQQKKKQMMKVNQLANHYFHQTFKSLPESHPVKVYAQKRGLTDEIIQDFQVGYSTEEWDGLTNYLQGKNVPLALAEEARLIKARTNGKSGFFDIFRDRLMFPIFSIMNEAIAFGGRIIQQGEPKYLNSPETLVFHKSKVLYGLHQTAKYIRTEDQIIIVEGYMDLVSLYAQGIRNVAATMGTALTPEHGKLIGRMTKNVCVLFDGDAAGQDAAERSLPILLGSGLYPKGLILPDKMDPDDFVKENGAEALRSMVTSAQDLFPMILSQWMKGYRGEASEKVKLCNKIQPVFQMIQDPRLKQLYIAEAAQKMNVDEKWLRSALGPQQGKNDFGQKNFSGARSDQNPSENHPYTSSSARNVPNEVQNTETSLTEESLVQIKLKGASQAEALVLSLVLKNHANMDVLLKSEWSEVISHEGVKDVLKRAADVYRQAPEKFDKLASLLTPFVDEPRLLIAQPHALLGTTELGEDKDQQIEEKLLMDALKKLKEVSLKEQVQKLTLEIKSSPTPEKLQRLMELQREAMNVRKT